MAYAAASVRVLLAIDASETAQNAVQLLLQLDPALQVTVLHVIDVEAQIHPHLSGGLLQGYHERLTQRLYTEANRFVPHIAQQLGSRLTNVDVSICGGAAAETIITTARTLQADLIVLGSRSLPTIPALLLGSVSYRVMHHAPCSVLVVKRPVPRLGALIVGVDRSPGAREALTFVKESGLVDAAQRTIVATALPSRSFFGEGEPDWWASWRSVQQAAIEFVQGMQKKLTLREDRVEGTVVEGDPAAALVALAQKESADLIIVGTRGQRGLRRILLGSVSQKVMQLATCSVLTVQRPPWKKRTNRSCGASALQER